MGRDFRPVKTIWGSASSCFMPGECVVRVLMNLADLAGCESSEELRDGLYTEVWIDDGKKFFAALKEDTRTPLEIGQDQSLTLLTPEEAAEDPENDSMATQEQFGFFMEALRSNADGWVADSLDPNDGSLRFYID